MTQILTKTQNHFWPSINQINRIRGFYTIKKKTKIYHTIYRRDTGVAQDHYYTLWNTHDPNYITRYVNSLNVWTKQKRVRRFYVQSSTQLIQNIIATKWNHKETSMEHGENVATSTQTTQEITTLGKTW